LNYPNEIPRRRERPQPTFDGVVPLVLSKVTAASLRDQHRAVRDAASIPSIFVRRGWAVREDDRDVHDLINVPGFEVPRW
jgi:hypothetical protein